MEINFINNITVSIIMLDESLASYVPDLDCLVLTATGDASTIWMKFDRVDSFVMVVSKLSDHLSRGKVPELYCSVIGSGCYEPSVWRELASSDPILMSLNRK